MTKHQVVIKRIVSPDGKVIAEAKSVAIESGDGTCEISQSVSVNVFSGSSSSSSVRASSSSFSKSSSDRNQ